jgi:hypothetical protein
MSALISASLYWLLCSCVRRAPRTLGAAWSLRHIPLIHRQYERELGIIRRAGSFTQTRKMVPPRSYGSGRRVAPAASKKKRPGERHPTGTVSVVALQWGERGVGDCRSPGGEQYWGCPSTEGTCGWWRLHPVTVGRPGIPVPPRCGRLRVDDLPGEAPVSPIPFSSPYDARQCHALQRARRETYRLLGPLAVCGPHCNP